jgi:hypothetical protein
LRIIGSSGDTILVRNNPGRGNQSATTIHWPNKQVLLLSLSCFVVWMVTIYHVLLRYGAFHFRPAAIVINFYYTFYGCIRQNTAPCHGTLRY